MKLRLTLIALISLILVLTLVSVTSARESAIITTSAGSVELVGTMPDLDIGFDGFCDGMQLTTDAAHPVSGNMCGCITGAFYGTLGQGAHLTHADGELYTGLHTIIRGNGTWEHWNALGFVNSGTWSEGCPVGPEAASLPRSVDR